MNDKRITINNPKHNYKNALYIMFKAFRINNNHSLEFSLNASRKLDIALLHEHEQNERNNEFFKKGIGNYKDVLSKFASQISLHTKVDQELEKLIEQNDIIVIDKAYLKEDVLVLEQVKQLADKHNKALAIVETNVIVPVEVTSNKEEYSARTIRSKIWKHISDYIDIDSTYNNLFLYEKKALDALEYFITNKLKNYGERNNPDYDNTSHLSAYLKYGFISPVTIYQYLQSEDNRNKESYLEELIIRRELAYNFIHFNKNYYRFEHMTYGWAYQTMEDHINDDRIYHYELEDYIEGNTHDEYFNAAMRQMIDKGYMHGYMRMYWAKKIIEWSYTYEEAYEKLVYLNNYYFIDGNTPNGYTGIAWCFGKHDRAWPSRQIFGKIRYMNYNGLKRKYNPTKYVSTYLKGE
jgi:deoxyribodipyrimidine photo-lyase